MEMRTIERKVPAGRVRLLDCGYLECVDAWGSDEAIVEAARMSTGKGFLRWDAGDCPVCQHQVQEDQPRCYGCEGKGTVPGDMKLLRRLWDLRHSTPFETAGMTVEVQAPILVFREWHRHRTQSYSERSARYTPLPDFNYVPTVDRLLRTSKTNKQAGVVAGAGELDEEGAWEFRDGLTALYGEIEAFYQRWLARGVPKELARLPIPVGRYSTMRASANLRNWLGFLALRWHPAAQEEIRVYAAELALMAEACFPRVWEVARASLTPT